MNNQSNKILVVGGGTAGLISSMILKKFLNIQVDLVYSKNIGIVGVGEGSTEHFNDFMNFVGIDYFSIIKECGATFKSGIFYRGWGKKDFIHSVSGAFSKKVAQYPYLYAMQISKGSSYLFHEEILENKIPSYHLANPYDSPYNQYHFDTNMLNSFLKKYASEMGIRIFEDDIEDIHLNEYGYIDYIIGNKMNYHYDFYIDSTGFKKILISKMGVKWNSFSDYLKMNSAIVFSTEEQEEYNLWTLAKAMDYGWRFQIPTQNRTGNGYIFSSDYINEDDAKKEIDKEFGYDVEISKSFSFDPGYIINPWIKNCVAVGLSGSFVEPLEATSIGTTIQQSYLLMQKIMNYSEKDIEEYNNSFSSIMNNIRDYVFIHYINEKNDTAFWKDIKHIHPPEILKNKMDIWKNKIPIRENFTDQSLYCLFWEDNYTIALEGLNLFNRDNISKEFSMLNNQYKNNAHTIINDLFQEEQTIKKIGHKRFIQAVKDFL